MSSMRQETSRVTRQKESLQRNLRRIDEQKMDVERDRDNLKGVIQALERGR